MVLDDQKEIEKLDLSKVTEVIDKFPEQCEEGIELGKHVADKLKFDKPDRVFVCGMGGSAIGGDLVRSIRQNSGQGL